LGWLFTIVAKKQQIAVKRLRFALPIKNTENPDELFDFGLKANSLVASSLRQTG
jgi:hypothetical protein